MDFLSKLNAAIVKNNSLLCVGLDPTDAALPKEGDLYSRLVNWGCDLIARTRDLACCYKPNSAYFEQFGPKGLRALQEICETLPDGIPLLLDFKRGDIGSTAEAYARAAFEYFHADAVTLSPYLGVDSIQPFLRDPEKAVFVLCQTSNPSAGEIQRYGNPPLFLHIARLAKAWGARGQVHLVIGATQPEALAMAREVSPEAWFLAPGVGAQGGDLALALRSGLRADGLGMIIPVSRGIMNAPDPYAAALALRDEINTVREGLKSGQEAPQGSWPATVSAGMAGVLPAASPAAMPDRLHFLATGLYESGCLQFGEFTLASGKPSPVYLDLRRLVSYPAVLDMAVEAYLDELVNLRYDLLAGVPYAALPIAAIAASKLRQPLVYPRKEAKDHGTAQLVEGVFEPGQKAVLIEDVITSGSSILAAAQSLVSMGLVVSDSVVLVDRGQGGVAALAAQGIHVHAVLTFSALLERLLAGGLISTERFVQVKEYLAGN